MYSHQAANGAVQPPPGSHGGQHQQQQQQHQHQQHQQQQHHHHYGTAQAPPPGQHPEHQQYAYPAPPQQQPHHVYPPPPNGAAGPNGYPVPPGQGPASTLPPPHATYPGAADPRADMQSQYRMPPPHDMYRHPMPPQYQYPPQSQPAPRQRTAIACRYCRRRKIRCSGFESSQDGKCQNCQRFSQECIFTPVSAQQAFVPAHAVRAQQGQPMQLYGAYGQPLPATQPPPDPYVPRNAPQPFPPQAGGPAYSYPPPPHVPYPIVPPLQTNGTAHNDRKRPHDEPHTPTLPPPNRQEHYQYPDPTALNQGHTGGVSPADSYGSSHHSQQAAHVAQPYYTAPPSAAAHTQPAPVYQTQARRPSPTNSAYSQGRASSSPRTQDALRPPSNAPGSTSRTPPPSNGRGPAMSIHNLTSGSHQSNGDGQSPSGGRESMDRDMLKKLR